MKATLEFDLPEENSDFRLSCKAPHWFSTLWDLDQYLRTLLKHGHKFKSADKALEDIRKKLYDLMEEHNISFDEVQ